MFGPINMLVHIQQHNHLICLYLGEWGDRNAILGEGCFGVTSSIQPLYGGINSPYKGYGGLN